MTHPSYLSRLKRPPAAAELQLPVTLHQTSTLASFVYCGTTAKLNNLRRVRCNCPQMDKFIDARFERLEKALASLIDSVTKYHPSVSLAEDLKAADNELTKGLERG
jgi:hypothetical protein